MTDRVGQQLGNYRLVRLLGQGGQASVYLGKHLHLQSQAAIKILGTELSDKETAKFLSEGQTLARLMHPQIVRISDFAVEQGTPFLVMDYASRGTLRQYHPYGTCLSLDTVVNYVRQIASALQYAHNHNVIHRDIKPENMLLGANQQVLLSDFGIALFTPSPQLLSTQGMEGTPPYMAPEQLRGKPCFASDQYALGIVVYEWLCGVRPFEGSYWHLLNQQASVPPPPLREKDPSLPEAVEMVVLKALSKDPQERYVSVQYFAQALERASKTQANTRHNDSEVTGRLHSLTPALAVKPQQILLSSSPADHHFVVRLHNDLQRRGITVSNEQSRSTLDKFEQENALRQALRATDLVALVVSAHTRTSHMVKEHLRIAALYQRRVVCVWVEGDDLAALLPEQIAPVAVIDAREAHYKPALDELIACLEKATITPSPAVNSPSTKEVSEPRNPYKGLRAFTEGDTGDFFGRERLITQLIDGVQERLRPGQPGLSPERLLAVIGPSGSGKSSAVMAGLLPRLRRGALPDSQEWIYLSPMVPGAHPLEALALTLAPHLPGRGVKSIREDLEDDSARGLHWLCSQLVQGTEKKVVLFIDQFEEAFNLTTSEDERERFFDLLQAAITERKGPVLVLLTFRADFYDRLMTASELGRLIEQHQSVIWPMLVDELRAAIKGPAGLPDVNLAFDGNLVGDLLYEVREQVGALPLLQFTLDQLFERRKDHLLTQQAYQEIGGVKGALSQHAEKTYLALPKDAHREAAHTLFLRLIDPGITEQDTTRRRASITELVFADAQQTALVRETLDVFVNARLLTANASENVETTVEVSHEALIREWPRLVAWLHTARDDIRLQHIIHKDVTEWNQRKQPPSRLYRGIQLKEAENWAKRNKPNEQEAAFLHASVTRRIFSLVSLIVVAFLVISSAGVAGWFFLTRPADPTLVTTLADNINGGSLRYCIDNAPSGSTITFARGLNGTIHLTGDLTFLNGKKLTIIGPGAKQLVISGDDQDVTIHVTERAILGISGLSFSHGHTAGHGFLFNQGTLTLTDSIISDNQNSSNDSTLGGAIYNADTGILIVRDSTISNNTTNSTGAFSEGGGIINSGQLTVINSYLYGNKALSVYTTSVGGAIDNTTKGTLIVKGSTISDNAANSQSGVGWGGGIFNDGKLTLTDSTLLNNTASSKDGRGQGGGIYSEGQLTVSNSTLL